MELPFGGSTRGVPRPARLAGLEHQRGGGDVARSQAVAAGAAATRRGSGSAADQHGVAVEQTGRARRVRSRRSPARGVQDSSRRARPAMVALRAAWAAAMPRLPADADAASWLVTSATMNSTTTVTMSVGLSMRKVWMRRGEEEIVGQSGGERGEQRRARARQGSRRRAPPADRAGRPARIAPARRDREADQGRRPRPSASALGIAREACAAAEPLAERWPAMAAKCARRGAASRVRAICCPPWRPAKSTWNLYAADAHMAAHGHTRTICRRAGRCAGRRPRSIRCPTLMLGAIGVVYGDIGTSPLYAMKESFIGPHPLAVDPPHIFGVLSLIFWSLMLIVTVKYVLVAMRADNQAARAAPSRLLALISRNLGRQTMDRRRWSCSACSRPPVLRRRDDHAGDLGPLGGRGADRRRSRASQPLVMPISIVILIGLFLVQSRGTAKVGAMFGPVVLVYFAALAALGVVEHPRASRDPRRARARIGRCSSSLYDPKLAFLALGSVFLAVTGAETLYADMGHFGRKAIGFSWLTLVYPVPDAQLYRPGRAAARHAGGGREPLLPDGAGMGAAAAGRHRHRRDDHRQPGGDLGRLLGHPPGGPARLPAAPPDRAHQREGGRADLHPGGQLGPAGDGHAAGPRLPRSRPASPSAYGIAVTGTMLITTMMLGVLVFQVWKLEPRCSRR